MRFVVQIRHAATDYRAHTTEGGEFLHFVHIVADRHGYLDNAMIMVINPAGGSQLVRQPDDANDGLELVMISV